MTNLEGWIGKTQNFDPSKYKSWDELPEEQRQNFIQLENGDFITKSAAQHNETDKRDAQKNGSLWKTITGKGYKAADMAQAKIEEGRGAVFGMNEVREEEELQAMHKIRESMPADLKEKLMAAVFKGWKGNETIQVEGLNKAINLALSAMVEDPKNYKNVNLEFADQTTSVKVIYEQGFQSGSYPTIEVSDNGKKYTWQEWIPVRQGRTMTGEYNDLE